MSTFLDPIEAEAAWWHRSNLESALASLLRAVDSGRPIDPFDSRVTFAREQVKPGKRDEYRERARVSGRAEREAVGR